jgi:hypothetical protein
MSGNSPDDIDPVERVLDMIREYYADPEVMAAWGSADEEGQIPDEAARIIGQFKKRWRRDNFVSGGLIFTASIAARQIAEGKFSSPDDPSLEAWLEKSRAVIEKDSR